MATTTLARRGERTRSATWPAETRSTYSKRSNVILLSTINETFNEDLNQNPEDHFLSPLTPDETQFFTDSEYDSDYDSDDEGEWSAGIVDFSLFHADRQKAIETGEPLSEKWDSFLGGQKDALQRSFKRVKDSESEAKDVTPTLTPDDSPSLRDDMDIDDEPNDCRAKMPQIQIPNYLTIEVKPLSQSNPGQQPIIYTHDDLPSSFDFARKRSRGKVERPGLTHARTLSGRRHVWKRPDWDMFTVGEDVDGEERAEMEAWGTCDIDQISSLEL